MAVDNANWLLTCFYLLLHYIDITKIEHKQIVTFDEIQQVGINLSAVFY